MKIKKTKTYKHFLSIFAVLCCLIMTKPAFAEQQISFRDAVNIAFENNNELRAFADNLLATKKNIGIERSKLLPSLNFEEDFASTNNPAERFGYSANQTNETAADLTVYRINHPIPVVNFLTGIYLEQPVFNRKLNINLKIAKTEFSSRTFDYFRKREEIVKRVALAYYDVDRDQKTVTAAKKDVEESQENLDAVQLKYNNKKELNSAVLRASTALTGTKQQLVTVEKNLRVSKRTLGLVLGKEEPVDIIKSDLKNFVFKDECYYNNASTERNDIKSLEWKY